jgi:hypothetical protein
MPAKDPSQFIFDLLRAVRNVTGARPPPVWTAVVKVQAKLGIANSEALDLAIRLAVKKGWLRSNGEPASTIALTVQGLMAIETELPRSPTSRR